MVLLPFFLMADILTNSKARHEYHILETFEAGIVLKGTEVKALRAGKGQIRDAFARIENDQALLYNTHIDEYSHGNLQNHDPKAVRKLLLHKSEIRKLAGLLSAKGHALVPLSFYWKNGKVKVALGLGKGKVEYDKREDLKRRCRQVGIECVEWSSRKPNEWASIVLVTPESAVSESFGNFINRAARARSSQTGVGAFDALATAASASHASSNSS